MPATRDEILDAALRLPESDRLVIASRLMETLPDDLPGLSDDDPEFAAELDLQHAWDFARRPLDLIELLDIWAVAHKFGTRMQQHEANATVKLREKPDRTAVATLKLRGA